MAKRFLLDANVLTYFFNAQAEKWLAAIAKSTPLVIVEEVRDELVAGPLAARFNKWLANAPIEVRGLLVGGSGAKTFARLRAGATSLKDAGEHASIALATEAPNLVFVTNDRNAVWLALGELLEGGERVIRFPTFLRRSHLLTPATPAALRALATGAQFAAKPPTWWADWLASI